MVGIIGLLIGGALMAAMALPKAKRKLYWGDSGAESLSNWSLLSWGIFFAMGGVSLLGWWEKGISMNVFGGVLVMILIGFVYDVFVLPRIAKRKSKDGSEEQK